MKQKLFLDFDSTLINSVQAFCTCYNELYAHHPLWKPSDWTKSKVWDLKDECPLVKDPDYIFGHPSFFDHCDFIDYWTEAVVKELCEKYDTYIVSIGVYSNIMLKAQFIHTHMPYMRDKAILLMTDECVMLKDNVNMLGGLFIDDVPSNLNSTNALHKICFGDNEWGRDWQGIRVKNWKQVGELLL